MYKSAARFRCPSSRVNVGGIPAERVRSGGKSLEKSPKNKSRKKTKGSKGKRAEKQAAIQRLIGSIGLKVEGVIVGMQPYGVFVELPGKVVGLVHVSKISNKHVIVSELFKIGDKVSPLILGVEKKANYRIPLSLLESDFLVKNTKVTIT